MGKRAASSIMVLANLNDNMQKNESNFMIYHILKSTQNGLSLEHQD